MSTAIIGAGPAGALAATLLARRGVAVTLFEKDRFPRDKVCGECLSAVGIEVLRRHQLLEPLVHIGRSIQRGVVVTAHHRVSLPLPSPMLGISRALLDGHLLDARRRGAGVEIRQPSRVEAIDPSKAGVQLRCRDGGSAISSTESFARVLLADGRSALMGDKPKATGTIGIKTHFRNVAADDDAVTLYATAASYGGLAPIEDGKWNAAFAVPAALLKDHAGDIAASFAALRQSNRRLDRALASAEQIAPWLAAPLPRFAVRDTWPPNVIPLGNAAAAIEPVGGEGMGLALRSAELAVEAIVSNQRDLLASQYSEIWQRRRTFCDLGGKLLSSGFADAAVQVAAAVPLLGAMSLKLIGK